MRCKEFIAFCIVFNLFTTCSVAWAVNYAEAISSVDAFLNRQLNRFTHPGDYPPQYSNAALIQTFDVEINDPSFITLYHRADVYDSALAAIYYMQRGNVEKARNLLDGLRFVQEIDPYGDGRVRKSYWANDLYAPNNTGPSIDDSNAPVGDTAWAGIALTRFYAATGEGVYLDAARAAADWINSQSQFDQFGGFALGRDNNDQWIFSPHGRSTEHAIDVYVMAVNLFHVESDQAAKLKWLSMANHAQDFVRKMYDEGANYYYTGTEESGGSAAINPVPIPTDAQTWSGLAAIGSDVHQEGALEWLTNPANGMIVEETFRGLKFSNGGEHIQSEVTAGAAMAIRVGIDEGILTGTSGDPTKTWEEEFQSFVENLEDIRNPTIGNPAAGADSLGMGVVATPWPGGAPTGYDSSYPNLRHVASTVWHGLTLLLSHPDNPDPIANPLRPLAVLLPGDFNGDGQVDDADLSVWQDYFGIALDGQDFLVWQRNYGVSLSSLQTTKIPEPTSVVLISMGGIIMIGLRRGTQHAIRNICESIKRPASQELIYRL